MTKSHLKICHVASVDITLRFLLFSQLKYLQDVGFEVWAISSPGKWTKEIEDAGIRFQSIQLRRKVFTPFEDFIALIQLFLLFRKEKFSLVHTHTLKASFLGQLAAFFAGVPARIYTIHGLDFQGVPVLWKRILFRFLERIIARIVDVAFSVNKEDIEMALEKKIYPKEKLQYLPLGIDLTRFNPDRFSPEFCNKKKKELGMPLDARIIGIVARLVREKGYFELFEAFAQVLKQFPNTVLMVVGKEEPEKQDSFSLQTEIRRYGIAKHVHFLGERTDVEELYPLMDVFVLPTWREAIGISILEASAMRRPVVATAIRGCREAAEHGKTAILVPPKNPQSLARTVIAILSHPELAKKMGEEARKKVMREFNGEIIEKELKQEYDKLLAKYSR